MTVPAPPSYADADELRSITGKIVNEDGLNIDMLLLSVSRAIDGIANRPAGFVAPEDPYVRTYAGSGAAYLRIDEAVDIDSVSVKLLPRDTTYTEWDSEDWLGFSGDPRQPNYNDPPFTALMAVGTSHTFFTGPFTSDEWAWVYNRPGGRGISGMARQDRRPALPTVQVSARFGYAEDVPPVIKAATLIWAARLWKRGKSAFADTLVQPDTGQLVYRIREDPDFRKMLVDARLIRVVI